MNPKLKSMETALPANTSVMNIETGEIFILFDCVISLSYGDGWVGKYNVYDVNEAKYVTMDIHHVDFNINYGQWKVIDGD